MSIDLRNRWFTSIVHAPTKILRKFFTHTKPNLLRWLIPFNERKYSGQVSSDWQRRAPMIPTIHEAGPLGIPRQIISFPSSPLSSLSVSLLFPFALCAPVQTGWMIFWSRFLRVKLAPLFQIKRVERLLRITFFFIKKHNAFFNYRDVKCSREISIYTSINKSRIARRNYWSSFHF